MLFRALIVMSVLFATLPLSAAEKLDDAGVGKLLVGKWNAKYVLEKVNIESTTEYRADGTFTVRAMYQRGALEYAATIDGTWKVRNSKLTETCTKCAPSDFVTVGEKTTDTVREINDTAFRYLSSSGNERTKVRVTSGK